MASNPILTEIRNPLHGQRVSLRCPEEGDGVAVYEAVVESLQELRRWPASLPWVVHEPSRAASEEYCRRSKSEFVLRLRLPYLVVDRETEMLIGCMGVNRIDWKVPRFEIGFWCRTSCHGQGLMADALTTLISYLKTAHGARRLECQTDFENARARALCERAGMTHEATQRNERAAPDGQLRHNVIYSITD